MVAILRNVNDNPRDLYALRLLLRKLPLATIKQIQEGPPADLFIEFLNMQIEVSKKFDTPAFWRNALDLRMREIEKCRFCENNKEFTCPDHVEQQTLFFNFTISEFNADGSARTPIRIARKFSAQNCETILTFLEGAKKSDKIAKRNELVELFLEIEDY